MLNETMVVVLVFCLISQASSLASSIILVPTSMMLMLMMSMETLYSGILALMFIMVFIGGLMVLLVSVASVIFQEQWIFPSAVLMTLTLMVSFFLKEMPLEWQETATIFLSWFTTNKIVLLLTSLSVLTMGLMSMTYLLMSFKGMIRSI